MTQTGYCETLLTFLKSDTTSVVNALKLFAPDAGESQVRAWRDSIRLLRQSVEQMLLAIPGLSENATVLLGSTNSSLLLRTSEAVSVAVKS